MLSEIRHKDSSFLTTLSCRPTPITDNDWVIPHMFFFIRSYIHVYTVSQKNRTPVTYSNNSNNPGSMSTNFGTKHRHLINT